MCTVSMIGDEWSKRIPNMYPWVNAPIYPNVSDSTSKTFTYTSVSTEEFEKLKKEVEAIKKVLIAAKIYDEETGQPDCEVDEKVALIKKLAELVGVDVTDIFK